MPATPPPAHCLPRQLEALGNLNDGNSVTNDQRDGLIRLLHDTQLRQHAGSVTQQAGQLHGSAEAKPSRISGTRTRSLVGCSRSALNPPRSLGRENKFPRRSLTRRVGRARTDDDRIMSPGL